MASTNSKIESAVAGYLEEVAGPHEGQVFELGSGTTGIGRSEDNAIVVQSGGVSRYHAVLEHNGADYIIRDNGSKNGVQVNGSLVEEVALNHGDVIQIGDSAFRFYASGDDSQLPPVEVEHYEPQAPGLAMAPETQDLAGSQPVQSPADGFGGLSAVGADLKKVKTPGSNRRPIIYGSVGLILLVLWLGTQDSPEGTKDITSDQGKTILENAAELGGEVQLEVGAPQSELAGLRDPSISDAERVVKSYDFNDSSILEAEQFFRRGRRDYLNKEYHRAIQSLATALDLDRKHRLATIYLKRAVIEAEEEAKKHLNLALKYFESLQYQRAIYHFEQVESYMQHKEDHKIVKQSKKYIEVSRKRLQGAELFP